MFGSARLVPESQEYRDAVRLGRLLAARGDVIVSGGYAGIMEAVSRGAHEAGGTVVGAMWRRLADAFREFLIVDRRDLALLTLVDTIDEALEALDRKNSHRGGWRG